MEVVEEMALGIGNIEKFGSFVKKASMIDKKINHMWSIVYVEKNIMGTQNDSFIEWHIFNDLMCSIKVFHCYILGVYIFHAILQYSPLYLRYL